MQKVFVFKVYIFLFLHLRKVRLQVHKVYTALIVGLNLSGLFRIEPRINLQLAGKISLKLDSNLSSLLEYGRQFQITYSCFNYFVFLCLEYTFFNKIRSIVSDDNTPIVDLLYCVVYKNQANKQLELYAC